MNSPGILTLVPFSERHFAVLSGWFRDEKDVVQWGGPSLTYPLDPGQLIPMLAESRLSPPLRLCWMAEDGAGNTVGHAQLAFDWRNGVARLARVAIAPPMRGKGLAILMLHQVLAEAFSHEAIERTELNVYTWNAAAIRTYSRLGFVREGVRRSSAKIGDDRWDTAIMGMLRREWLKHGREIVEHGQRLDAIRAGLDAAVDDPLRHGDAAVSAHFDGLFTAAEKTAEP